MFEFCRENIKQITTPIYPLIPIDNGNNPPLFANSFKAKSLLFLKRIMLLFVENSYNKKIIIYIWIKR